MEKLNLHTFSQRANNSGQDRAEVESTYIQASTGQNFNLHAFSSIPVYVAVLVHKFNIHTFEVIVVAPSFRS